MLDLAFAEELPQPLGSVEVSSHLYSTQFVDDTLLFARVSKQHLNNIKLILHPFEIVTGLKINFNESYLIGTGAQQTGGEI